MGEEEVIRFLPLLPLLAMLIAAPAAAKPIEAVDPAKPPVPTPGATDAVVVVRFHATRMAGDNRVDFQRWDAAAGKPILDADGKPAGFRATFSYSLFGGKKDETVTRVLVVPAGDYVMASRTFNGAMTDSFCFGAPRFTLAPGSTTYLGDFEMQALRKAADGVYRNGMRYHPEIEPARAALAALYPDRAGAMTLWQPVNGTRLPCIGDEYTAYGVPGAQGPLAAPLVPPAAAPGG